jgi:hypothetical protein
LYRYDISDNTDHKNTRVITYRFFERCPLILLEGSECPVLG